MKNLAWLLSMAWRDSRRGRRRLILFVAAMSIGVAGLVAIRSFQDNIRAALDKQAGEVLGADLALNSRRPLARPVRDFLAAAPADIAWQRNLSTMLRFTNSDSAHLVRLRAISPEFPFYGQIVTDPPEAATTFHSGNSALVDEALMIQAGAAPGDTITIGHSTFTIAGRLVKIPGEVSLWTQLSPRVFIPNDRLDATGLIQPGSRLFYRALLRVHDPEQIAPIAASLEEMAARHGLRVETIASRQERLGRTLSNVYRFLDIFAIAAVLLGGIGVGSAVHVYMRQKLGTVAILRCLGASRGQTMGIYLLQMLAIGLLGSLIGTAGGILVQHGLPTMLTDLIPHDLVVSWSWPAIAMGLTVGLGITLLLALLPLLSIRRISPLTALRATIEPLPAVWRDPLRLAVWGATALGLYLLIALTMSSWRDGAIFAGAILLLLAALAAFAALLIWLVRHFISPRLPFVLRQGLNNLYRPNNQTPVLMMCLGLGAFLFALLFAVQHLLLAQLAWSHDAHAPNTLLFDIQPDELPGVQDLLATHDLPVIQSSPIVTMRLSSIAGRTLREIREEENPLIESWALNREYRSSYRDHLSPGEDILQGEFVPSMDLFEEPVPISVEEGIAKDLQLAMGDEIVWDVQGLPITTYVASIRRVDWYQMRPNFFVIFPTGILEEAPHIHLLATRIASPEAKANLQRQLLDAFPTVSFIDAASLISTLDGIFGKLSFAIRFMSMFSVGAGVVVLIGAVATSRYQRLRESVLLRTIGASRRQIKLIAVSEFAMLGAFAALSGTILALFASWILARFWFEATWLIAAWPLAGLWFAVSALTIIVGLLNTRQTLRHPPLQLLREQEAG